MPHKTPLGYVEIRVFAHATEDQEKVLTAVRNTLPTEIAENIIFQKTNLTGHHGNPITLFQTKITNKQALPLILEKLASTLNALDKEALNSKMKLHLEKHNLYLRFNKQAAYMGKLRLSSNDPIHFKIHFKNKTPEEITTLCRETGLLP
ncbi:MAG: RNA-binding domain-containing protein [Candidatus Bathyarchaeia archaeon]